MEILSDPGLSSWMKSIAEIHRAAENAKQSMRAAGKRAEARPGGKERAKCHISTRCGHSDGNIVGSRAIVLDEKHCRAPSCCRECQTVNASSWKGRLGIPET